MTLGLELGNARVRARRAGLLRHRDLVRLAAARDVDGLLGELAATSYLPEVEHASARFRGLRALDDALGRHLARTFRELLAWYAPGRAASELELLAERWDQHDLRTVLRGQARLAPADDVLAALVPAARLDDASLASLAGADGVRAVLERLVVWDLPSPEIARRLFAAFPRYEARRGDVRVLEAALDLAYAERLADVPLDDAVAEVVRGAIDRKNLDTALRLRGAARRGEPTAALEPAFLPMGLLDRARFERARDAETREAAAAALGARDAPKAWRGPLARWVSEGDVVALADALDEAETRERVAAFWRSDPLSLAIPVAFVVAKENEVRNLRRLGRGLAAGATAVELELALVTPW